MEVPHVVILPFPAQGHIKPMFLLAKLLSAADFKVTFVNTHHNSAQLLHHIHLPSFSARFPNFHFKSISDGLPADHTRAGPSVIDLFRSTSEVSKPEFRDLIISISQENGNWERPTCIIADGIMSFAVNVGEELEIPVMAFRTYSATCTWVYFHLKKLIECGEIPVKGDGDLDKQITCIPGMETILRRRDLPNICKLDTENPILQFFIDQTSKLTRASALILNTFEELEAPMVSQLWSIFPHVYTIGPLHSLLKTRIIGFPSSDSSTGSLREQDTSCLTWLDSQAPKSVIFVSFGSIVILTRDQLIEFWHGLVDSEKSFLWVIRSDLIFDENETDEIPSELKMETNERGVIVDWAPQEAVLAHQAVGGFLTHSGWNSTLESIVTGIPMICWPQIADQQVNSRCVSEMWRIGLDMKYMTHRSIVERMVRDVMECKIEEIVKATAEISAKACYAIDKNGSSYNNIEKLIENIRAISVAK